jgi:hypothetical protein
MGAFGETLGCDAYHLRQPLLIKAHNELISHEDDGDAHLAALLDHFLTFFHVGGNVVLGICNVILGEEFLRHLAKVARWGAVNGDWFIHRSILGPEYSTSCCG